MATCECSNLRWEPEHYGLEHHPDCKVKAIVSHVGATCETSPGTAPASFVPDLAIDADHPLGRLVNVFLDGAEQKMCFEARVKWESFERPAFGELIVESEPPSSVHSRLGRIGETERCGLWVKSVTGQVYLEVKPEDRAKFAEMYEIARKVIANA